MLTLCPTFWLMMLQKGGGEGVSQNAMLLVPWAYWMDGHRWTRVTMDGLMNGWTAAAVELAVILFIVAALTAALTSSNLTHVNKESDTQLPVMFLKK